MDNPQIPRTQTGSSSWKPILQFIFSLGAALIAWFIALIVSFTGVLPFLSQTPGLEPDPSTFLLAAGAFAAGLLLAVSAWFALLHLTRKPERWPAWLDEISGKLSQPWLLVVVFAAALATGYMLSLVERLRWLLPPLHVAAVLIPLYLLVRIGQSGLPVGSLRRAWGVFAVGLVGGPSIVMVVEILAGLVFMVIGMLYLSMQPELLRELMALAEGLRGPNLDQEALLRALEPYLQRPEVLAAILLYTAGVVPLVEEVFKSIGVWFGLGKEITPARGFTAGLISGAGFAFFENLTLTAQGQDWAPVVIARIGTAVLHIATTGAIGWALALAWKERKVFRLLLVYLGAVLVHGIWNGTAILAAASNLGLLSTPEAGRSLEIGASIALIGLAAVMFIGLIWANHRLRSEESSPEVGDLNLTGG